MLTEPDVGSDAANITTSARLDGDEWIINGSKAWVTNGSEAGLLNVYAKTGEDHRSMVAIVVDADTPGVTRTEPYDLMGAHAMGTSGIEFNNVRVGIEKTLIPVGEAIAATMNGIDLARVLVGAMCCGLIRRSLQTAIAATARRQAFGGTIANQQGVQWMLWSGWRQS